MGAKQYYLRLRLERCYEHLQNPMLTEREIAERMQFSSAAYFSLFFKSKTGMTPSEYRATRLSD
jgi:AraC-like DNA-binding protein